jgi:hypothetical protein
VHVFGFATISELSTLENNKKNMIFEVKNETKESSHAHARIIL